MTDQGRVVEASGRFMEVASRLPHLLSLSDETVEILYLLDGGDGDESELVARLEEVEAKVAVTLDRCAWTVRDLERLSEARKAEADKLREQAKRLEATADRLKGLMLTAMQATGQQRIDTPRFVVRIQKSPPSVKFDDEPATERIEAYDRPPAGVPLEYVTVLTLYKVDKRRILQDVKATGELPPGTTVHHGSHLRIA